MSATISAASPSPYVVPTAVTAPAASPPPASPAAAPASNPVDVVSLSAAAVAQQGGVVPTEFTSANEAAGAASQAVGCLQVSLVGLNSDLQTLQPKEIRRLEAEFGVKDVDAFVASTEADLKGNEGQIAGWSSYLQSNFQITGPLVTEDDAGSATLGSFTLSYQGSGFAMKGSSTGAFQVTDAAGAWTAWAPPSSASTATATLSGAAIALAALKGVNRTV